MMDKGVVLDGEWKEKIQSAFDYHDADYKNEVFHNNIWDASLNAFDIPREVQVVIDANDSLYITHGNPGLVWFSGDEHIGMKLPLKCWIHTHPFGRAYFSGTDWRTINTWRPLLPEAIVLGGDEKMTWFRSGEYTVFEKVEYLEDEEE